MPDLDRVSSLVQETMDQFDASGMDLAALARRCQRIASLRGDGASLVWLGFESTDMQNAVENKSDTKHEPLASRLLKAIPPEEANRKFTAEYHAYITRRRLQPGKEEANLLSIQQIEGHVQMLRDQEAALVPALSGINPYDLGKYVSDQQKMRLSCVTARMPLDNILARVRDRLWEFLTETEHELTFGEATAAVFDRLRSYVDRQLTTISPPALEQFQAAYRRLMDGGNEDRAHALTSCRRVLKTLADQLYPASSTPVKCSDGETRVSRTTCLSTACSSTSSERWATTRTVRWFRRR